MLQNFYTTWVWGVAGQKQRLGPKLEGDDAGLGEHPKKKLRPLLISTTTEATLNLVHKLGLGLAYQKTTFRTKIGWV